MSLICDKVLGPVNVTVGVWPAVLLVPAKARLSPSHWSDVTVIDWPFCTVCLVTAFPFHGARIAVPDNVAALRVVLTKPLNENPMVFRNRLDTSGHAKGI
jgi:hypothetical protein